MRYENIKENTYTYLSGFLTVPQPFMFLLISSIYNNFLLNEGIIILPDILRLQEYKGHYKDVYTLRNDKFTYFVYPGIAVFHNNHDDQYDL
jgi:hypothetical protein